MTEPRAFLRWAGSKRKQLHRLRPFWSDQFERYVEPFAGSACLFFDLQPKSALLGDQNSELIEMYRVVRRKPNEVFDRLQRIPRNRPVYEKRRAEDPASLSAVDRAARFIYLNRNCFNGIYRTNSRGQFNVPFSNDRVGEFVSRNVFSKCASVLRKATLESADFGITLRSVRRGDFVYLDPPYAVQSRRIFREYGSKLFSVADLVRLAAILRRIDSRGAAFVLSYADCREIRDIAKDWNCTRTLVRRHVAGFSGSRKPSVELIITNIDAT